MQKLLPEEDQSNILAFDPGRRDTDESNVEFYTRRIIALVRELELRNEELEHQNTGLLDEVARANERISQLEQAVESQKEATLTALNTVSEMLTRVEAVVSTREESAAARFASCIGALGRVLNLQRKAVTDLEVVAGEVRCRGVASDRMPLDMLRETRRSIRLMGESIEATTCGWRIDSVAVPLDERVDELVGSTGPIECDDVFKPESPRVVATHSDVGDGRSELSVIEVVAWPFRNFATLTAFHRALQQVQGVVDVKAQGFEKGILRLTIEYGDSRPFVDRLMEMPQFKLRLASAAENQLELEVMG